MSANCLMFSRPARLALDLQHCFLQSPGGGGWGSVDGNVVSASLLISNKFTYCSFYFLTFLAPLFYIHILLLGDLGMSPPCASLTKILRTLVRNPITYCLTQKFVPRFSSKRIIRKISSSASSRLSVSFCYEHN